MINRKALNSAGVRVTNQRALVLDIIKKGQGHLDADEIYRQAREKNYNVSLSTVYRALQLFKRLGLVKELHFDEAHHHYEAHPAREHHHLVCLGCGKLIEFRHSIASYVKKNVAEAKDFEISDAEIRLSGYCPDCRKRRN